jgi:HEPN domain-containing protein
MRQAEADVRAASDAGETEHFEWAAFASHQAAEKAIKALYQHLHLEAWGHALLKLFEHLPDESRPRSELIDQARELIRTDSNEARR